MNESNLKSLKKRIQQEKLSTLLITTPNNVRYLSSFHGTSGFILSTPKDTFLLTDFRYIQKAKSVLPKSIKLIDITRMMRNPEGFKGAWQKLLAKHKLSKIGFEPDHLTISRLEYFKKISSKSKLVSSKNFVEDLRQIKDSEEIRYLTKSQRINEETLKKVVPLLKPGVTEQEIAVKIRVIGFELGADDISFEPIVGFQESSASPHHEPGNKKLRKNQVVLIDMGMKYKGYCSDMTRTYLPRKATAKQKEVYSIVLEAQENCIKNIKAGISGGLGDEFARSVIKKAGYGDFFGHSTGHGIGLDIHEAPNQSPKGKDILPLGTVVTAEPGIYLPGNFGVRIEDMVIIEKDRAKVMTKMPKKLEEIMIL